MYALQVSPCFSAIIFLSILTGHYRSKRCTQTLVADASCNNPSSSYRGESSCKWYLIYFSLLLTSYIIRRGTFLGAKRTIFSSKHYDPAKPTDHEPNVDDFLRDEIGLIWAITIKVSIFPLLSCLS